MLSSNTKISIRQLQTLFIMDIFGTGVIIMPRIAADMAHNDGWILILGAVLFALLYVCIVNSLSQMFPRDSFVEYSGKIMGKPIGFVLSFGLAFRLIFTAGIELRIFGEILRQTMLYNTPIQVTCGLMILLSSYIVLKGYETRARMAEILIFIVFIPLFGIFLVSAYGADFTNLMPVFKTPPLNILVGSFYMSFAFRGIELALLIYPFVNKPMRIKRGQLGATLFIGLFMLFVSTITLLKFGEKDTRAQIWPVIQMMDTIDFPGKFFERQDAFILSFWIISIFISLSAGVFFSSFIYGRIFRAKTQNIYIVPCAAIIFVISLLPENIVETYRWLNMADMTMGIAYLIALPVLLLGIAKLRRLGA